jgi:hypothetical protein
VRSTAAPYTESRLTRSVANERVGFPVVEQLSFTFFNLILDAPRTIPLLQIIVFCEKFVAARHDIDIGIQLLFANNRNRVRRAVLGLSQDGARTDLFENHSENS